MHIPFEDNLKYSEEETTSVITKKCNKCWVDKPLSNFANGSGCKYRNECKSCNKIQTDKLGELKKIHGFFPADPNYKCPICGRTEDDLKHLYGNKRKMVLDHNHKTGEFRGFICNRCNTGLSNFEEDEETLKNAIKYVKGDK
tara:strand:+ start:52 stop:477 length:426 start_codon:yes stop_codon:yes gene_type:complete